MPGVGWLGWVVGGYGNGSMPRRRMRSDEVAELEALILYFQVAAVQVLAIRGK